MLPLMSNVRPMLTNLPFAIALATLVASADAGAPPPGWRSPQDAELHSPADHWREGSPARYESASGDFDGDGKQESARLLVSSTTSDFGVYVLSSGGWSLLHRLPIADLKYMGLRTLPAGRYRTACGKGYWACAEGEPAELTLTHDALLLFKNESAESAFVWSAIDRSFHQVWLSD